MIPYASTTITVKGFVPESSQDPNGDGYDSDYVVDAPVIAVGVRACITLPAPNRDELDQLALSTDSYVLRCDLFDDGLDEQCLVIDDQDGIEYRVLKCAPSKPLQFGLEHFKAVISRSDGIRGGV